MHSGQHEDDGGDAAMKRIVGIILLLLIASPAMAQMGGSGGFGSGGTGGGSGGASSSAPLSGAGTPASPITLPTTASPQVAHLGINVAAPANAGELISGFTGNKPALVLQEGSNVGSNPMIAGLNTVGADLSGCGAGCQVGFMVDTGGIHENLAIVLSGSFNAVVDTTGTISGVVSGLPTPNLPGMLDIVPDVATGMQLASATAGQDIFVTEDAANNFRVGLSDIGIFGFNGANGYISGCTESGTTATCTTTATNGLATGNTVIVNATEAASGTVYGYNGKFTLTGATANTFSYTTTSGLGNSTAGAYFDTDLYRSAKGVLSTDGSISISGASCTGANGYICVGNAVGGLWEAAVGAVLNFDQGPQAWNSNVNFEVGNNSSYMGGNKIGQVAKLLGIDNTGTNGVANLGEVTKIDRLVIKNSTQLPSYTVAGLPATCTKLDIVEVSDATTVAAGACVGTGTNATIAVCSATNTWSCL